MTEIIHFFEGVGGKIVGFLAAVFALKKLYDMLTSWRKRLIKESLVEVIKPLSEKIDGLKEDINDLKLADKDLLPRQEAYEKLQSVAVCKANHAKGAAPQSNNQEKE